jgi:predicted lipoprotein with Yx(FWY)xxD motif
MSRVLALIFAGLLLGLAGCGGGDTRSVDTSRDRNPSADADSSGDGQSARTESGSTKRDSPASGGQPGITIATEDSQYGTILFDGDHQAIYLFAKESSDRSECYDECAAAWPPVLTAGSPRSGGDVNASLLGTTPRSDGTTQVTYKGHPLYYYESDPRGQVLCQDVVEFGGRWLVIDPTGNPVE